MNTPSSTWILRLSEERLYALLWNLGGFRIRGAAIIDVLRKEMPIDDGKPAGEAVDRLLVCLRREGDASEAEPGLPIVSPELNETFSTGKHVQWAVDISTAELHRVLRATEVFTKYEDSARRILTKHAFQARDRYRFFRSAFALNCVFHIANGAELTVSRSNQSLRRATTSLRAWCDNHQGAPDFSFDPMDQSIRDSCSTT